MGCTLGIAFTGATSSALWLSTLVLAFGFAGIGWNGVQHTWMAELAGPTAAGTAVGLGLAVSSAGVTLGPLIFGRCVEAVGDFRGPWIGLAVTMIAAMALLTWSASVGVICTARARPSRQALAAARDRHHLDLALRVATHDLVADAQDYLHAELRRDRDTRDAAASRSKDDGGESSPNHGGRKSCKLGASDSRTSLSESLEARRVPPNPPADR
jgi:MFS family permease